MKGETQIMADEAFQNAVQSYHDVFLKSDRVQKMVASGACTQHDFREVFRNNIEKRVRSLPEIDGLSKETVLTSWMAKFDCILKGTGDDEHKRPTRMQPLNSESILTKEQLFDMFQQVLGVKKFEHQLLFNAMMVKSRSYFVLYFTLSRLCGPNSTVQSRIFPPSHHLARLVR